MTTHPAAQRHYKREDQRTVVMRLTHIVGILLALAILTLVFSIPVNAP